MATHGALLPNRFDGARTCAVEAEYLPRAPQSATLCREKLLTDQIYEWVVDSRFAKLLMSLRLLDRMRKSSCGFVLTQIPSPNSFRSCYLRCYQGTLSSEMRAHIPHMAAAPKQHRHVRTVQAAFSKLQDFRLAQFARCRTDCLMSPMGRLCSSSPKMEPNTMRWCSDIGFAWAVPLQSLQSAQLSKPNRVQATKASHAIHKDNSTPAARHFVSNTSWAHAPSINS